MDKTELVKEFEQLKKLIAKQIEDCPSFPGDINLAMLLGKSVGKLEDIIIKL